MACFCCQKSAQAHEHRPSIIAACFQGVSDLRSAACPSEIQRPLRPKMPQFYLILGVGYLIFNIYIIYPGIYSIYISYPVSFSSWYGIGYRIPNMEDIG
jgi:hypothetical protein